MSSLPPGHLELAKRLRGKLATSGPGVRMFWATVTAVDATHHTVTVQQGALAEVSGIDYDGSFAPAVGNTVWGLAVDGDLFVCGKRARA